MSDALKEERWLVRRMLKGDERAFETFFDSHFPRLYRFALARLGGDAAAAEEAAQAALCRGVERLRTYRGESALFTWLCTICRHEIGRRLRQFDRSPVGGRLAEDAIEARGALESLAAALEEGPDASLDRRELSRLVQVTLDNLPWSYAAALEWKYLQEMPVKEIAERLQLGLKAAESLLTRARAAFREGFTSLGGAPVNAGRRGPHAERTDSK